MADTISFTLSNDQMTDVTVDVVDSRTNRKVLDTYPLNRDESASVSVVADSGGKGAAVWAFWSPDGSVNSNNRKDGINDGDQLTLG